AESLGINMHTVRSAYLKLRDQGIINMRLGRRARIAPLQPIPTSTDAVSELTLRMKEVINDAYFMGFSSADLHNLFKEQLDKLREH
ncbi:hypothetical protein ACFLVZ_03245, partial [Chloroflexota bacterium]